LKSLFLPNNDIFPGKSIYKCKEIGKNMNNRWMGSNGQEKSPPEKLLIPNDALAYELHE